MRKIFYYVILTVINKALVGTRFFGIKNRLLNMIGISVGKGSKVVGPIFVGYCNKLSIGEDCWIGKRFTVDGNGSVIIQDRCDLAPYVVINTGGHEVGDSQRRAGKGLKHETIIQCGSWIGTNVTIINGAKIGESAIVAAGSVVIKNIDRNTLVAGVPAKMKKILD